jgi:TolB protein
MSYVYFAAPTIILLWSLLLSCTQQPSEHTMLSADISHYPAATSVTNTHGLGEFDAAADVGEPKLSGKSIYDAASQQFTLTAGGFNMWFKRDEMQFVHKKLKGDFIVRANVQFVGKGTDPHRKLGWIARSSLQAGAKQVSATIHGDGLTSLQYRHLDDTDTEQLELGNRLPDVVQLERRGNTYIMSTAKFGEAFTQVSAQDVELGAEPYVGLFVCSHNAEVLESAIFSNVRIILPVDPNYQPYRDYIGSNLELMDVASGKRKIVYRATDSIQAPNWTWDNKTLIFNSNGKLFNYDLAQAQVSELHTGLAINNNNDHVLSWNGKQIAISHHNPADNDHSTIYTLPIDGSDNPQQITAVGAGHSFLHGFSPDDKDLIFTANRDEKWNIYKINIASGKETPLTNEDTLSDGSEYSPDGQYIYFNSARSGTMQIWRMLADGSEVTQITHDDYNDWFPHISPDGKQMVMLSYLPDVPAADHPFYKHVYLRIMPVDLSTPPKIIAYVYGGQGTINVPSWSPDGNSIAFISNSRM